MSGRRRVRAILGVPVLAALTGLLGWGYSGAPGFGDFHGRYGTMLNAVAVPERHTTNAVTAVVFDYRGFDTMGEELILFAAVVGVVLLLRDEREPTRGRRADPVRSEAIRMFGVLMVGVVAVVGLWLAAFGLVTPGGGFQGGVVLAGAVAVVFLACGYQPWRRFGSERLLDPFDGGGATAYIVVGIAALVAGTPFLHNLLGSGRSATLASGGSMTILNWAVAVEVAAANLVLYTEFLESYLVPHLPER
jgi:multicomponent Na+:H+ antiporter subunit B